MSYHFLSLPATGINFHWLTDAIAHQPRQRALSDSPSAAASELHKGATFWIDQPLGCRIRCVEGTLWLTVDGCHKDYILEAGDSLLFDTPQPLAIHALSPSVYVVS